jgi:Arc/MetJ-type ribon-helix-helix transcriptional regulator
MDIQLSPEAQRFIDAQVQLGVYRSASEVIEALVEASKASKAGDKVPPLVPAELAVKQRQRILQVVQECETLSVGPRTDGFTNRDHDRILYGERS